MTTRMATGVITDAGPDGIVANDAHELARITYRQLDHWARQGWVLPSVDLGRGRAGRRLYSPADVVRLDLLRHLAVSKVNTAQAGPQVSNFEVCGGDMLVLWGPVGGKDIEPQLKLVARDEAVTFLAGGGAWVVYDPAPLTATLGRMVPASIAEDYSALPPQAQRRSA